MKTLLIFVVVIIVIISCKDGFFVTLGVVPGTGLGEDSSKAIIKLADDNYIVTGFTQQKGSDTEPVIVKIDGNGEVIWAKYIDVTESSAESRSVVATYDGGFAIVVSEGGYILVAKFDTNGNEIWVNRIGEGLEIVQDMIETSDHGIVFVGSTQTYGTSKSLYIAKLNLTGGAEWGKWFSGSSTEEFKSVIELANGDLYAAGLTRSYGEPSKDSVLLCKFDSMGTLDWSRIYYGTKKDGGNGIVELGDGMLAITGYSYSMPGSDNKREIIFLQADPATGNLTYAKGWGSGSDDHARGIIATNDGGAVLLGSSWHEQATDDSALVMKYSAMGELQWSKSFGDGTQDDKCRSAVDMGDGTLLVVGDGKTYGSGNVTMEDIFVATIDEESGEGCGWIDANELEKDWSDVLETYIGSWDSSGSVIVQNTTAFYVVNDWGFDANSTIRCTFDTGGTADIIISFVLVLVTLVIIL